MPSCRTAARAHPLCDSQHNKPLQQVSNASQRRADAHPQHSPGRITALISTERSQPQGNTTSVGNASASGRSANLFRATRCVLSSVRYGNSVLHTFVSAACSSQTSQNSELVATSLYLERSGLDSPRGQPQEPAYVPGISRLAWCETTELLRRGCGLPTARLAEAGCPWGRGCPPLPPSTPAAPRFARSPHSQLTREDGETAAARCRPGRDSRHHSWPRDVVPLLRPALPARARDQDREEPSHCRRHRADANSAEALLSANLGGQHLGAGAPKRADSPSHRANSFAQSRAAPSFRPQSAPLASAL